MRARLSGTRARPYLLLICLAFVWGVHWPVAKIGLRDLPPFTYGALRVATGLAVIVGVLAVRRGLRLPSRHDVPVVLSVGIGQMAAGIALMNFALPMISAGRSSILVYTMPLWVALIQLPMLRAGGARRQVGGLLVGLAGIAMLLNPQAIDWQSSGQLLGSAALLFSAVLWAVTTIHLRRHGWRGSPLDLMPWQLFVALVPLVIAALALESGRAIHWEPTAVAAVLYSGPLATALAFWLSQSISRSLSPLATTMGFLAVPVVGLASSWIMLGEPLTALDLAGAATTFLGIVVVSMSTDATRRAPRVSANSTVARAEP
ncbi:MAG: DMT family transporter [Candidatus Limnocylindrales bacterium]|jgi:drug/metabolite transporter (DMT)-like permease